MSHRIPDWFADSSAVTALAAIAGRGVFDFFRHLWIANPGVPRWRPGFCLAFDVASGAWLARKQ